MTLYKLCVLTMTLTVELLSVPAVALAKADCELKQLLTGGEFERLQKKWPVDNFLPESKDKYGQISPSDEIYFYDTKSLDFKEDAILRWRKSDEKLTIKNRSDSDSTVDAECQQDYISEKSSTKSCQYDNDSPGPLPMKLQLSQKQANFLKVKNLKWDTSLLVQMGPIRSYQTSVDPHVCDGLGDKNHIEFESWIMEKVGRSKMVYEVSVKVKKDADKCEDRNLAFRKCLHGVGVDGSKDRGTKTEAVYSFFHPES